MKKLIKRMAITIIIFQSLAVAGPIHVAAYNGNTAEVMHLISSGKANIDEKDIEGATAIMWAAIQDHSETVIELHRAKADIEAQNNVGMTALIVAATFGNTKTVRVLLEAKAHIEAKTIEGTTALLWAAKACKTEIVKELLAHGANFNAKDDAGWSLISVAFKNKDAQLQIAIIEIITKLSKDTAGIVYEYLGQLLSV